MNSELNQYLGFELSTTVTRMRSAEHKNRSGAATLSHRKRENFTTRRTFSSPEN